MKLVKGSKVKYTLKNKSPVKGKIVHVFEAYQVPNQKKLLKYYGKEIINPKYASLFGPMASDRIVIKKKKGDYIILPLKGIDRYFQLEES